MSSKLTKILCFSLLALSACQSVPTTPKVPLPVNESADQLINETEVIAVVNTQVNAVDLEQQAAEWGYSLKTKEKLEGLDMYIMTFRCPPGIDPHNAVVELERLQADSTVGVNHKYDLQLENTVFSMPKTGYADSLISWPETGCDAHLPIGIIDGGISPNFLRRHKERIVYKSFIKGTPPKAATDHGSAIASILVEPNRLGEGRYYIAAVVSEDEKGQTFSGLLPMLKALDWMVRKDVKVVNVSLAGPNNPTLEKAIKRASDKGVIIVAAVGNDGKNAAPRYPAAFESVIAATAVNKDGKIYENAVRGSHVDFAAPGVRIYIPELGEGQFVSGTSIAAPFVTAMIASHSQNGKNLSVYEITKYLSNSSVDLGANGKDPIYGLGLIKAKTNCSF